MKEDFLESFFHDAHIAIAYHEIILDGEGRPFDYRFIRANPAFGDMTGLEVDAITGKTVREVLPGIGKSDFDWIGVYGGVAMRKGREEFEQYSEPLGRWYRVYVHSPEKGFFTTVFTDITERKNAELKLAEKERKLSQAQIASRSGAWEYDINTGALDWTPECEELFGLEEGQFKGTFEGFLDYVHPEDLAFVIEKNQPVTESKQSIPLEYDHRIVKKGGDVRWVRETAGVVRDENGSPGKIAGLVFDITDRKLVEEELSRAVQIKSDFVSVVSHELRTPLAIIKESAALVSEEIAGPLNPQQAKLLSHITGNIDRLGRLISDVLDFRKQEMGHAELAYGTFNINELVKEASEMFKGSAEEKGVKLSAALDESIEPVSLDRDKIMQVLTNLLHNAVKFTDEGEIKISTLGKEDSSVEVSVTDSGQGLGKDAQGKIFDPFMQGGGINDRQTGGVGLGLPIAKNIIDLHKGAIRAGSAEGGGARFVFTLPGSIEPEPGGEKDE